MKKVLFFIFGFLSALLLAVLLFVPVVNFCGRGVTDQPWVRDLYPLKTHFAKERRSPKIIIIGGSSSLFGISGEQLQEYTGMDNINFSMSIMVPMRFYLTDLENNVREGDIVVLPLELGPPYHNTAEDNFSQFGLSLLFGSIPETQKTLSFRELCSLYFRYGFSWINSTLFHRDGPLMRWICQRDSGMQNIFSGVKQEKYVYAQWKKLQTKEAQGKWGYFSDLSIHGDWQNDQPAKGTDMHPYLLRSSVSDEFLLCYKRIKELTEQRRAVLLLVWPNIYFYSEQTVFFEEFKNLLASKGITIYGRPEATAFPKYFYFDPIAHMNRHGAELWTYELAKTISQTTGLPLKKRNQAWPYTVFAENPARSFPGVKAFQIYDTGVRIEGNEFPMVLDIPENLRGKPLELNLIAKPERPGAAFSGITVCGTDCQFEETIHAARTETLIAVPAKYTGQPKLNLTFALYGNKIGLERSCVREDVSASGIPEAGPVVLHTQRNPEFFTFCSGFACQEDWGRWTDGPNAKFTLRLPSRFRKKNLRLKFDVNAFVHAKKPVCRFRLLSQGKLLKETSFYQFSGSFAVELPKELTKTAELPFELEIADSRSPYELGIGTDTRKLGVGLRSITIMESAE